MELSGCYLVWGKGNTFSCRSGYFYWRERKDSHDMSWLSETASPREVGHWSMALLRASPSRRKVGYNISPCINAWNGWICQAGAWPGHQLVTTNMPDRDILLVSEEVETWLLAVHQIRLTWDNLSCTSGIPFLTTATLPLLLLVFPTCSTCFLFC